MSAEYNIKFCYSIAKLLMSIKEFWLRCKYMSNFCFIPSFKQRGCIIRDNPAILDVLHLVCFKACVSVFLWLCSQQCFGCVSTAAKGRTRYVLSETPAPLLGPGSASNPGAIFATICGQICKQIRLIAEDVLIRPLQ